MAKVPKQCVGGMPWIIWIDIMVRLTVRRYTYHNIVNFQDANTFVPNNANVAGVCKDSDAETLVLSFKEFSLEFSFAKVSLFTALKK